MPVKRKNQRKNSKTVKTVAKSGLNKYIAGVFVFYFIVSCLIFTDLECFAGDKKCKHLLAPDPWYYNSPFDIWDLEKYNTAPMRWRVFAYKDNVKIFQDTTCTRKINSASFLEKFFVLNKKGRSLEIEGSLNPIKKGWARIEEFVILPHAVRTGNSISYKALPINRLNKITGSIRSVTPRRSPYDKASSYGNEIKILELAYIYAFYPVPKKNKKPQYLLLGKKPVFHTAAKEKDDGFIQNVMLGWVPYERILTWNTREALQPYINKNKINAHREKPIYYFKTEADLTNYQHGGNIDEDKFEIKPETIYRQWPKDAFRYPILHYNKQKKYCHIGIPNSVPRVIQAIEWNAPEGMDVVFLIDGTKSMEGYIPAACKIARQMMADLESLNSVNPPHEIVHDMSSIRFGIAVYRDYKDKHKVFEKPSKLTKDKGQINTNLSDVTAITNDENLYDHGAYPEALFLGIERTILEMNWKNNAMKLIIVIGDAGNHYDETKSNLTPYSIASLLFQYDISLAAIQIIDQPRNEAHMSAQSLFCSDIHEIIINTLSIYYKEVERLKKIDIIPESIFTYDQYKKYYNQLTDKITNTNCEIDTCSQVDDSRWNLTCLYVNTMSEEKHEHISKDIKQQIENLSIQLSEAISMVDTIRVGSPDISNDNLKKNSYKPQLMPGIVSKLIKSIGINVLSESSQKQAQDAYKTTTARSERDKIAYQLGSKELKKFLANDAQFYTEAFVPYSPPLYKSDKEPQFNKMVLFSKKELEILTQDFSSFDGIYMMQLNSKELFKIWNKFLKQIIGEPETDLIYEILKKGGTEVDVKEYLNKSIRELFFQEKGVQIKDEHRILRIPLKDLIHNLENYDIEEIEQLTSYLVNTYKKLKSLLDNPSKFFKIFGHNYIWIKASDLP